MSDLKKAGLTIAASTVLLGLKHECMPLGGYYRRLFEEHLSEEHGSNMSHLDDNMLLREHDRLHALELAVLVNVFASTGKVSERALSISAHHGGADL